MNSKRFICLLLCVTLLFSLHVTTSANSISDYMTTIYSQALKSYGKSSFDGYCGACVGWQLKTLGINSTYIGANGNYTYDKYSAMNTTSGGYTVNCFPASSNSLSSFLNYVNTCNTSSNYTFIVLGFQKGSSTQNGQDYGHALLIYSVCGGTVYFTESWGTSVRTQSISDFCYSYRNYTTSSGASVYQYEGAIWFINNSQITQPPSTATLSVNKSAFSVGETVCFSATCNVSASYTIGIDKDGTRIYTGVVGSYFEKSFSEPGDYSAYVSAWNSAGLVDSNRVNFSVYNSAPNMSKLTINKSVVVVGEEITFNCEAQNATGYTIGIYRDNERILTQDIGQTFVKSFSEPGEYCAYISAWNTNGLVDSNYVGWVVYDSSPTSSELKIDKKAICIGDSIQFTCISKEATGYTIGINKDGVRIFTQDISKVFTKSFNEAGLYTAYVTSWNTRGICDSAKVSFEVYNTIPDNCHLTADKSNIVEVGDIINLKFDAHNAKLFEIGTYINGERVWITPSRGDYKELELNIEKSGVYEVWATSYNEYGSCDSKHLTFIAYTKNCAIVSTNGNSIRVVKSFNLNQDNYSCILGLYNDSTLVTVVYIPNMLNNNVLDKVITCDAKYNNIKIMAWNSLSSPKPLCETEIVNSSNFISEHK